MIDKVNDGKVLLAFGHQHLGLTQAAVTAEMIAHLATSSATTNLPPTLPALEAYRLDRF